MKKNGRQGADYAAPVKNGQRPFKSGTLRKVQNAPL
jgi:hypothetical protein